MHWLNLAIQLGMAGLPSVFDRIRSEVGPGGPSFKPAMADRFRMSLLGLQGLLSIVRVPRHAGFSGLYYLKGLLTKGHLRGLELVIEEKTGPSRMAYSPVDSSPKRLTLDARLMKAFQKAGLPPQRLQAAIDCWFIHEFLHFAQHMGFGRHSGLGSQSPWTLLAIDYQADAMAAIVRTQIMLLFGDPRPIWTIHEESIRAVIDQMDVFTSLMRADLDREGVARMAFPYEKLQRVAVWQFQYHRCRNFNRALVPADLQLLSQPFMHFRSLEPNPQTITRRWPETETAFLERPRLIVSAVTRFGTTAFARANRLDDAHYKELFAAIFSGKVADSAAAFDAIFDEHPWLIGMAGGDEDWNGPGGVVGPDFPPPPGDGEGPEEEPSGADERAVFAFTPKMLPLVVAEEDEDEQAMPDMTWQETPIAWQEMLIPLAEEEEEEKGGRLGEA